MSNRPTELSRGYVLQRLVRKYRTVNGVKKSDTVIVYLYDKHKTSVNLYDCFETDNIQKAKLFDNLEEASKFRGWVNEELTELHPLNPMYSVVTLLRTITLSDERPNGNCLLVRLINVEDDEVLAFRSFVHSDQTTPSYMSPVTSLIVTKRVTEGQVFIDKETAEAYKKNTEHLLSDSLKEDMQKFQPVYLLFTLSPIPTNADHLTSSELYIEVLGSRGLL